MVVGWVYWDGVIKKKKNLVIEKRHLFQKTSTTDEIYSDSMVLCMIRTPHYFQLTVCTSNVYEYGFHSMHIELMTILPVFF